MSRSQAASSTFKPTEAYSRFEVSLARAASDTEPVVFPEWVRKGAVGTAIAGHLTGPTGTGAIAFTAAATAALLGALLVSTLYHPASVTTHEDRRGGG